VADGIRLFIGVPVAAAVAGELAGTCESLARRATTQKVAMRWLAPAAYHVTVRYLGWTRREMVASVERAMQKAVVQALAALAAALEREVVPLGFQAEKRAFHAHVTIARLREPTRVDQVLLPFAEQVFSETRCDSLTLFESVAKPKGSEYREVLRVALSGTNSAVQRQSEPVQTGPLDASPGSDDGWK
jgi:2'-5' RNA ligase